jgi:Protein of unknown function (DUF2891)
VTRQNDEWIATLHANAAGYAQVALANIAREFPSDMRYVMTAPGDFPSRPRDVTPVFYGSFDWHSCVEMHWLLVRLLRAAPDHVPDTEIRATLSGRFTADALQAEARFIADPNTGVRQRPYGWGWALSLVHEVYEVAALGDPEAEQWAADLRPLADTITARFLDWLPRQTYPVRYGMHANSAFGLSRGLAHARDRAAEGDAELLDAIVDAVERWYGRDLDYPGHWEPSGWDFLSAALAEAELMASLLPAQRFVPWLDAFLPKLAHGEPRALFTPATVSDSGDGQIAHLHGLNASRAWCWRRIAESLPDGDPRIEPVLAAVGQHADAALPHVVGDDYMVEHWLAAYAVLLLS